MDSYWRILKQEDFRSDCLSINELKREKRLRPNNQITKQNKRLLLALLLSLILLATSIPSQLVQSAHARIHPLIQQIAAEQPDEILRIIVQKQTFTTSVEQQVVTLGGNITRDLHIINAFVAELPAHAIPTIARSTAVRWISLDAPMMRVSSEVSPANIVSDGFNEVTYHGNDSSDQWVGPWIEIGEDNGPDAGNITVSRFLAGTRQGVRIQQANHGIQRQVDLHSAESASLSFVYRRKGFNSSSDYVVIEISSDGGATWVAIGQVSGPATDVDIESIHYDISAYTSRQTVLRFVSAPTLSEQARLYIDDIQIGSVPGIDNQISLDHDLYLPIIALDEGMDGDEIGGERQLSEADKDHKVRTAGIGNLLSIFVRAIAAHLVWQKPTPLKGQGIAVAVVDSGIADHDDFKDANGNSRIVARVNFSNSSSNQDDFYGHGTHVAGAIGGNGAKSSGAYVGVAPEVDLIDVKVTDDTGTGYTSDVVAGLQWILNHKNTYNIKVANLSLNSTVPESYHSSPLNAALEILWFNRIVVVVSAGNRGYQKIYPPANDPFVITVGSMDDMGTDSILDDTLSTFSAYGITDDGFLKPDLVTPGKDIISVLASDDTNLAVNHPAHAVNMDYFRMSGTSMAAGVAAGAAALLLQDEPNLTPDQVKYRLMATAQSLNGYDCAVGAGYLDIDAAVDGNTTQSANTGVQASQLLWTGSNPITWNSVNWNSVNWNSVNWNSVNWNSVNWNSTARNSVTWDSEPNNVGIGGCYRYVRLVAESEVNGNPWATMAELNVIDNNGNTINQSGWSVTYVDSEETYDNKHATNAIDGNPNTYWRTQLYNASPPPPHEIVVDLGAGYSLSGFRYLPRQDGSTYGRIAAYKFYANTDGTNWGSPLVQGTFANTSSEKTVIFSSITPTSSQTQTIERRISQSTDDAEQDVSSGQMYRSSTDLELIEEWGCYPCYGPQLVGLRFQNIQIPQGATITSAYIEFEADETDGVITSLAIHGQATNHASTFSSQYHNINNRSKTAASVNWNNVPAWYDWNTGNQKYQTPDLASIVQEIVNRSGWSSGNSMAFIISGSGTRVAEAYDGESYNAPLLHIEYQE